MANYTKSTNFAAKDSLLTGNPSKLVRGTEIDTEYNNIATAITTKADLNSPAFTGTPTAPTASSGTNTTQVATTAFVTSVFPTSNIAFSGDNTHVGLETFRDNKFEITDNTDTTKKVNFEVSGLTTSTTRTLTVPDKNGTIALTSDIASVSALSTQNNTITTGTYSVSASSTISITATHAFSVGQEVFITFTNTSGSALAANKFAIATVTGTTAFTINYGSTVTSGGTVTVERYGLIAVANTTETNAGTSQLKAITPKQFRDNNIVAATALNPTSSTALEFTSIPSWVKRVSVIFSGLSLSANTTSTKFPVIQLGTGSTISYTTSGYVAGINIFTSAPSLEVVTSGIPLYSPPATLSNTSSITGTITLLNISGNTWVFSGFIYDVGTRSGYVVGNVSLGATLTGLRLYVDGVISFDAGTVNIMYE